MPALETPRVQAVCEYSETTERAEWNLRYAGARLDATTSGDDLALAVLRGMTETLEYGWQEGEALPNSLRLVIKDA